MENFVICLGFKKRDESLKSIPFMTCGNMDELPDSDMTYSLKTITLIVSLFSLYLKLPIDKYFAAA